MAYKPESKRKRLEILRGQLDNERQSIIPVWRDINDFILPASGRFFLSDTNKYSRRNLSIINSSGQMAANTCHAGMMSGITSPARPWLRVASPDPDLNEFGRVKDWNAIVSERMMSVFFKSNLYQTLPYRELAGFGTAPMSVEFNQDKVIHCSSYPPGSYYLAKDEFGMVNVFYREWEMTVRNIVHRFGRKDANGNYDWSNFSTMVKQCYERGQYETYVTIAHCISPNEDYMYGSPFSRHKKFASCYYERGVSSKAGNRNYMQGDDDDKYLEESGYDYFPVCVPRWYTTGEDVYATDCPGMTAIGDVKQLQHSEQKYGKGLDKMVDPTMVMPTSMANQKTTMLPGGIMYADIREGSQKIMPAHEVNLRIDHLDAKMSKIEQRISRAFYEDLFLMLAQSDRREITAREIDERHEEKLLALGPVLERLNQDLLNPLVDITFNNMMRLGMLPPPPEEIQGQQLKIEYISIMAQAQKMIGVNVDERFLNNILTILPVKPDAADKVDFDQYIDVHGERLSVAPGIIRSDEAVADLRAQRAQAEAQAAAMQNAPQMARTAKDLSETDLEKESALKAMMNGQQ